MSRRSSVGQRAGDAEAIKTTKDATATAPQLARRRLRTKSSRSRATTATAPGTTAPPAARATKKGNKAIKTTKKPAARPKSAAKPKGEAGVSVRLLVSFDDDPPL